MANLLDDLAARYAYLDAAVRGGVYDPVAVLNRYSFAHFSDAAEHGQVMKKEGQAPGLRLARFNAVAPVDAEVAREDSNKPVWFTTTTFDIDRDGDLVFPQGIETENFHANPVIDFGHYESLAVPIAKGVDDAGRLLWVNEENRSRGGAQFNPKNPDSMFIRENVLDGFLSACSIAFVPLESERRTEHHSHKAQPRSRDERPMGYVFKRVDLTGWAIVAVPANAGALRDRVDHASRGKSVTGELLKAARPYCALSVNEAGGCWTGWCKDFSGTCRPCQEQTKTVKVWFSPDGLVWDEMTFPDDAAARAEARRAANRGEHVSWETPKGKRPVTKNCQPCVEQGKPDGESALGAGTCGDHKVKAQPSSSVPPDKACQILEDGETNGKPLTQAQRGMFGAACNRGKGGQPVTKDSRTPWTGPPKDKAEWLERLDEILRKTKGRDHTQFPTADLERIYRSGATPAQAAVAMVATERSNYEGPYRKSKGRSVTKSEDYDDGTAVGENDAEEQMRRGRRYADTLPGAYQSRGGDFARGWHDGYRGYWLRYAPDKARGKSATVVKRGNRARVIRVPTSRLGTLADAAGHRGVKVDHRPASGGMSEVTLAGPADGIEWLVQTYGGVGDKQVKSLAPKCPNCGGPVMETGGGSDAKVFCPRCDWIGDIDDTKSLKAKGNASFATTTFFKPGDKVVARRDMWADWQRQRLAAGGTDTVPFAKPGDRLTVVSAAGLYGQDLEVENRIGVRMRATSMDVRKVKSAARPVTKAPRQLTKAALDELATAGVPKFVSSSQDRDLVETCQPELDNWRRAMATFHGLNHPDGGRAIETRMRERPKLEAAFAALKRRFDGAKRGQGKSAKSHTCSCKGTCGKCSKGALATSSGGAGGYTVPAQREDENMKTKKPAPKTKAPTPRSAAQGGRSSAKKTPAQAMRAGARKAAVKARPKPVTKAFEIRRLKEDEYGPGDAGWYVIDTSRDEVEAGPYNSPAEAKRDYPQATQKSAKSVTKQEEDVEEEVLEHDADPDAVEEAVEDNPDDFAGEETPEEEAVEEEDIEQVEEGLEDQEDASLPPAEPRHGAQVLASLHNHLKAAQDYLMEECGKMDHPGLRGDLEGKFMDHLSKAAEMLEAHHGKHYAEEDFQTAKDFVSGPPPNQGGSDGLEGEDAYTEHDLEDAPPPEETDLPPEDEVQMDLDNGEAGGADAAAKEIIERYQKPPGKGKRGQVVKAGANREDLANYARKLLGMGYSVEDVARKLESDLQAVTGKRGRAGVEALLGKSATGQVAKSHLDTQEFLQSLADSETDPVRRAALSHHAEKMKAEMDEPLPEEVTEEAPLEDLPPEELPPAPAKANGSAVVRLKGVEANHARIMSLLRQRLGAN